MTDIAWNMECGKLNFGNPLARWSVVHFQVPGPSAKRVTENGPVADSRLLAKVPAKPVGLFSTQLRTEPEKAKYN